MTSILILTALFTLLIQSGFWLCFLKAFGRYKSGYAQEVLPGISIVICAKNARNSLESNLPFFLDQDYPRFELIVVDDHSSDGSLELLGTYRKKYPALKIVSEPNTHPGKKEALILGIQTAQFEWIALSDADCRPASNQWLNQMTGFVFGQTDIVIGYAPFGSTSGFLNKLIRFESCLNAITMFSAAICARAYAATGRNLMYRKSIFDRKVLNMALAGGDDDLLVNARATSANVRVCLSSESFIYSDAKKTWKDYFLQKWRHYGVSLCYNFRSKVALFFLNGSLIGFYVFSCLLLYAGEMLWFALLLILYWFVRWPVFCKFCNRLKEEDLCLIFPVVELIYVFQLILHTPFLFIKKKSW